MKSSTSAGLILSAGAILCIVSVVGLNLLGSAPDPSDSYEAFEQYEKWSRLWFAIAAPGLVGAFLLASGLVAGIVTFLFRERRGLHRE
jgi:hypothetical protein